MMRGILVTVMVGSLYAVGYVLVNGLDGVYDLFGLGLKLAGAEALAASLAGGVGSFAIWLGTAKVDAPAEAGQVIEAEPRRVYVVPLIGFGAVLLALAGYLLFQGDSGTLLDDLSIGDCFQSPAEIEVAVIEVVSCEEPHDEEVFAIKQLPHASEEPYPGLFAVDEASFGACLEDFSSYVGADYETSELEILWITPTGDSWGNGDRRVVCSLIRLDLQRSVGTARALGQ